VHDLVVRGVDQRVGGQQPGPQGGAVTRVDLPDAGLRQQRPRACRRISSAAAGRTVNR
jgi:hypothetical protein